jgi:hypothetical protein
VTLHAAGPGLTWRRMTVAPFAEGAWLRPTAMVRPAAIEPRTFYDASRLWLASAGMRVHVGTMRPRWGRYGAATTATAP